MKGTLTIRKMDDVSLEPEQIDEMFQYIKSFLPDFIIHDVYIEIWDQQDAQSYFHWPLILKQPLGPDKPVEGFHKFEINGIGKLWHVILLINNDNLQRTLTHELIHVICAELIGPDKWVQWRGIFHDDARRDDPFEFVAIACAEPTIIESYQKKGE